MPRTFVFLDLSGFTNYTAAFGDDAAGRLLTAFRTIVREVASDRGVRIAKWLGDGCMVVAVEQADAIAFTLDLENRSAEVCSPLTLRAGLATGLRLAVRGRRLHRVGRQHGGPPLRHRRAYEVLIPTMGLERLPEGVVATPHGPVELAGFPGPIEVFELSGVPRARPQRHRRALDPVPVHLSCVLPSRRVALHRFADDRADSGKGQNGHPRLLARVDCPAMRTPVSMGCASRSCSASRRRRAPATTTSRTRRRARRPRRPSPTSPSRGRRLRRPPRRHHDARPSRHRLVVEPVAVDLAEDLGSAGAVALIAAQSGRGHLLIGYAQDERRPSAATHLGEPRRRQLGRGAGPGPADDQTLLTVERGAGSAAMLAVGGSTPRAGAGPRHGLVRRRPAELRRPDPSARRAASPSGVSAIAVDRRAASWPRVGRG